MNSYTTAVTASNKLDYFGTLRGRYCYLFTPSLLVYGTGGFSVVRAGVNYLFNWGEPAPVVAKY